MTNFFQEGASDDGLFCSASPVWPEPSEVPQRVEVRRPGPQSRSYPVVSAVSAVSAQSAFSAAKAPDRHGNTKGTATSNSVVPTLPPLATEEHIPFLLGEEVQDEIRLSDGKKISINDVLETAEWYVLWKCSVHPTQNKPSDQGRHTRAAKQLPFHRPERVYRRLCRPMGRPFPNLVPFHCR